MCNILFLLFSFSFFFYLFTFVLNVSIFSSVTSLEDSSFSAAEAKQGVQESIAEGKQLGPNIEPIGLRSLSHHFVFGPTQDTACHWLYLHPAHDTAPFHRFPVLSTRLKDVAANFPHTLLSCTQLHGVMSRSTFFYFFPFLSLSLSLSLSYSFQRSYPSAVPALV
jgi:hypothetical protein